MNDQAVTLDNLGMGAAAEMFSAELKKVLDDIQDPNTEDKAARSVTLKVNVKPKDRGYASVSVQCRSSLAKPNAYDTEFFFGRQADGTVQAFEHNPQQMRIQFDESMQAARDAAHENVSRLQQSQTK